mgnify:FL=1
MAQMTMGKKDRENKKKNKAQDKEEKKAERKANNNKGKGLDEMMAYLDEDGNIVDTPPDPKKKKKEINVEDIVLGAAQSVPVDPSELVRTGVVKFFDDKKGYGFINDLKTQESIFVHTSSLDFQLKERDKVTFEIEKGPKGPVAVRVKKA